MPDHDQKSRPMTNDLHAGQRVRVIWDGGNRGVYTLREWRGVLWAATPSDPAGYCDHHRVVAR